MSWKELKAAGAGERKKSDVPKLLVLLTIATFLMFGVFLIKGGYEKQHPPVPLTQEDITTIKGHINNLEELNDVNNQLIELYKQKIITLGGEVPTLTIKGLGR